MDKETGGLEDWGREDRRTVDKETGGLEDKGTGGEEDWGTGGQENGGKMGRFLLLGKLLCEFLKKWVEAVFNVSASISVPVAGLLMSLLLVQLTNKMIE